MTVRLMPERQTEVRPVVIEQRSRTRVVTRVSVKFWKMLLLIAGLAVGLALVEGYLRIAQVSFPLPYTTDPHCGTRLQPGFRGWFHKEGHAYVEVNTWGFRDVEWSADKPEDVFRIAVLGDSYAEALQVMREETFWSIMETELQRAGVVGEQRVEVLNFGVSGFGTAQELLTLRNHAWQFDPDAVLLLFVPGNDVRNNSKRLEPYQLKPFFVPRNGDLVPDFSFRQHPDYLKAQSRSTRAKVWLINRSRLLQLLNEIKHRMSYGRNSSETAAGEPGLDDCVYWEPEDDSWKEAWDITERILMEMHQETRQRGALFVVAMATSGSQVDPDPAVRQAYQDRLGVEDLFYPERRIERLGTRCGFPVVSLARPMREHAEEHRVYLHGFENTRLGTGHWNVEGHAVAGRVLAERLKEIVTSRQE